MNTVPEFSPDGGLTCPYRMLALTLVNKSPDCLRAIPQPGLALCETSACMAWRWTDTIARKGYCGMAGPPRSAA